MSKRYLMFVTFSLILVLPVLAGAAGPASIGLSPESGSYKVGQTFTLTISMNPGGEKIDVVRTRLSYPADILEIQSFYLNPIYSYQAGSNSYDNSSGKFSWGAGIPGGTQTANNFGTVTFKVKKEGQASVAVAPDSMALSEGEDRFNGQSSSASFALTPALTQSDTKQKPPVAKNQQDIIPDEEPVVEDSSGEVETQIISDNIPESFRASLMNSLRSRPVMIAAIILLGIFAILLLVILRRNLQNMLSKSQKN